MLASAAKATGRIALSVPPASTTSTSPCSISRCASTKAWTPEAQAATEVITGPRSRFWMLIWQAAMDGREHRHHEGTDPLAALLEEDPLAGCHVADPAAAGVDDHRDLVPVGVSDPKAGMLDGLCRGGDGELAEAAHAAGLP